MAPISTTFTAFWEPASSARDMASTARTLTPFPSISSRIALGIGLVAGDHRHGVDFLGAGDHGAAHLQIGQEPGGLQLLEGQDHIGLAGFDNGGIDLVPIADIGDHRATPLAHAVDLADFYIEALVHHGIAQNTAGKQGALPAHADNHNAFVHKYHLGVKLVV